MARYRHVLSHEHKLTCDMGQLVPIAAMEVLPGDSYIHRTNLLARVAPLVNPVMHTVQLRVHHWFVPSRILWDDWEDWRVGKSEADKPRIQIPADAEQYALLDHMGLPPATGAEIDALPVRAYNKIWNEYYRDQDLSTPRDEDQLGLARISWEKDYFTTARAYPQQGDPVAIPFAPGTRAPVEGIGIRTTQGAQSQTNINMVGGETENITGWRTVSDSTGTSGITNTFIEEDPDHSDYPNIYADLSAAEGSGIDINDLRLAMALQTFGEVRAQFGSRYVDYIRYLGVNPGQSRLDRPEFLGGGAADIAFSEVLSMAESQNTEVGDMFGHGIAGLRTKRYRRSFPEDGWMISMISARPRTVYMDGIERKFQRFDPMDHWNRELEVLPWQEVKMPEVHHAGDADTVFGYVPKYDEYRHERSHVSGNFRSGPEIDWHMAREFDSPPTLNESFITCDPTDRIYGDTQMPELLINATHHIQAARLVRSTAKIGKVFG